MLQVATNQFTTTLTNGVGFFLFPSIRIGAYEVTAQLPGMESWRGTVSLLEGRTAELGPLLKPGGATTEVTVAGNVTLLVTTNSPTVATVVECERIEQLPINGRVVSSLMYVTTPGLEVGSNGSIPRNYGLRYASEYAPDGAILENRELNAIPAREPGLDTVEEFRVETTTPRPR